MKKNNAGKKILWFCWGASFLLFIFFHFLNRQKFIWAAWGEASNDTFGTKVAPAGDVNGDGFADAAVWSPGHGNAAGKVYVFLGSIHGLSKTPAWAVQGEGPRDQYGHSFGTVGDVNGDGFGDFIAAAQGFDNSKAKDVGKAYLYLGSPQGLSATPVWTKTGESAFELLGDCSGPAGDVNQDGLNDVVVGAYGFDHFRGMAYVFYGAKNGGLSPAPGWTAYGENKDDWFGYSVASSGDIRGDGFPGVVIGGKQHPKDKMERVGKVYVYYGSKKGLSKTPSWTASGETEGELFGWRALPSGDIKGDGHNGLIVSGYMYGNQIKHYIGKVCVYFSTSEGLSKDASWTMEGESSNSLFGYTIASGDFNHDGFSDVMVGAPGYQQNRGKIYLFLGSAKGLPEIPSWTMMGETADERFGSYLAKAGDVNGDGYPDVLVGAPDNSEKGDKTGKVYLLYGGKNGKLGEFPR